MASNEEILEVLKPLVRIKGRVLPLSLVYRTLIKEGLYSSAKRIAKALKRLEISGKIKPVAFGMSIELMDADIEVTTAKHAVEYVQSTF